MIFRRYKSLESQVFEENEYMIVPIRDIDKYDIMQWRNDQIYHLRQDKPLTKDIQDLYFKSVIDNLFDQSHPKQILFSFIKNNVCIGYGGLVHINWVDMNAEISFIMDTRLERDFFEKNWTLFLRLIERVAFKELALHKLYVYAFDVRPNLYGVLESNNYFLDARLIQHCCIDNSFKDVIIYSKLK